jgi:asparagine synthase (glutamine-hydrolysing)
MSGIVGIVNLDGAPVDAPLLRRMTASLAYRGPDSQRVWVDGSVGLGHALLRTDDGAEVPQPCSLDGSVWITADARIDARADLVCALAPDRALDLAQANDAHVILRAYQKWAEDCVEHLLGDFAFAIWNARTRRLFCARDHFGVKPFYYAHIDETVVFSNTLDCVRLHPGVRDTLDELAVGDFLLFGFNQEAATTTFADVRRLPPAHSLGCGAGLRVRKYWTLPTDGEIRYCRTEDYVDSFREIFRAAVADRLGTDRIGVWMSGGLDSTSIAAIASRFLFERYGSRALHAYTIVYDHLIPDTERQHASVAARGLEVPIHCFAADGYGAFDGWERAELWTPEPGDDPFTLLYRDQLDEAASDVRVLLCGDGGDEVLRRSEVSRLMFEMAPLELAAGLARSLFVHRQRPDGGLTSALRRLTRSSNAVAPFPDWLNRAFERRLGLRDRWRQLNTPQSVPHRLRPDAYRRLVMPFWPSHFESWDPGATRTPVEVRYPYLDVRLVEYLMGIPPIPWFVHKRLLREAMRGRLPEAIRKRPKAPLGGDPFVAQIRKNGSDGLDCFEAVPELMRYVERAAVPRLAGVPARSDLLLEVRPLCLNYWLKNLRSRSRVAHEEVCS